MVTIFLFFSFIDKTNRYDKNALLIACEFGKYDVVDWLINVKDIDVNSKRDHNDHTSALMYACAGCMFYLILFFFFFYSI